MEENNYIYIYVTAALVLGISLLLLLAWHKHERLVRVDDTVYLITNENDLIQKSLVSGVAWSSDNVRLFRQRVPGMQHFVNVGAHIGTAVLPIAKFCKHVTAIEAYPPTFHHLRRHVAINKLSNVSLLNNALGSQKEDVYFLDASNERIRNNSGGMHVLTQADIAHNRRSAADAKTNGYRVQSLPLDALALQHVDAMLVDVEGMEESFIQGSKHTLQRDYPVLIIEIWNDEKRKQENMDTSQQQVVDSILSIGYNNVERVGKDDFLFTRRPAFPRGLKIPRQIWRTSHMSQHVIPDLLREHSEGFTVHPVWSDEECSRFLNKEFGTVVARAFDVLNGAHKADLWRYAILFKRGGVYLDVKVGLYAPLSTLIDSLDDTNSRFSWLTVRGQYNGIFNGIIATPPGNPIILAALRHAVTVSTTANHDYGIMTRKLMQLCEQEYGSGVANTPTTLEGKTSRLMLLSERCDLKQECSVKGRVGGTRADRYNLCCNAYAEGRLLPVFQIRDPRYPWRAGNGQKNHGVL